VIMSPQSKYWGDVSPCPIGIDAPASTLSGCFSASLRSSSGRGALPHRTLPSGWAGCYTCPALRPYQFGPMRNPDVTRRSQWSAAKPKHRLWSRTNHQPPGPGDV